MVIIFLFIFVVATFVIVFILVFFCLVHLYVWLNLFLSCCFVCLSFLVTCRRGWLFGVLTWWQGFVQFIFVFATFVVVLVLSACFLFGSSICIIQLCYGLVVLFICLLWSPAIEADFSESSHGDKVLSCSFLLLLLLSLFCFCQLVFYCLAHLYALFSYVPVLFCLVICISWSP